MKKLKVKLTHIDRIKKDVYLLRFTSGYLATHAEPGQFLHVKIDSPGLLLRRPFSIHRIKNNTIYLLFRIRGKGTHILSNYKKKDWLDIIGPLGKGFDYTLDAACTSLLVAGGMGIAPLLFLAEKLNKSKKVVLVGAETKSDVLGKKNFKSLGCKILIATEDGSLGFKGTVTDLLKKYLSSKDKNFVAQLYACGPTEMFQELAGALKKYPRIKSQVSFEQFMGCGVGLCRACVIKTKRKNLRACKDGPVFDLKDVF